MITFLKGVTRGVDLKMFAGTPDTRYYFLSNEVIQLTIDVFRPPSVPSCTDTAPTYPCFTRSLQIYHHRTTSRDAFFGDFFLIIQ